MSTLKQPDSPFQEEARGDQTPELNRSEGGTRPPLEDFKSKKRPKAGPIIAIVLIVLIAGGYFLWRLVISPGSTGAQGPNTQSGLAGGPQALVRGLQGPQAAMEGGMPSISVPLEGETYLVEATRDRQAVEISGNLEPRSSLNLQSRAGGRLNSVLVSEGDEVDAGQVIARLDRSDLEYQIASKEYEIEQERLSGSPRRLELMEMQLQQLRSQLENYVARSNITGTVSSLNVEAGDEVAKGETLARIIDTRTMIATVNVDEIDILSIELGQEVEVYLDALPDSPLYGRVSKIGLEGSATGSGFATVPLEILFETPDPRALPGFSFSGDIYVAAEEDVMVVDKRALQSINDDIGIVYVVNEDGQSASPREVGYSSFGQLQYKITGIEAGSTLMQAPKEAASGSTGFGFPGGRFGSNEIRFQSMPGGGGGGPTTRSFRAP